MWVAISCMASYQIVTVHETYVAKKSHSQIKPYESSNIWACNKQQQAR